MKKLILVLVVVLAGLGLTQAQERVNKPLAKWVSESPVMQSPTLWYLQEGGQWEGIEDVVIKFRIKSFITGDGAPFYSLYYASNEQSMYGESYIKQKVLILSKSNYNKLKEDINTKKGEIQLCNGFITFGLVTGPFSGQVFSKETTDGTVLSRINKEFDGSSSNMDKCFVLSVQSLKTGLVLRFATDRNIDNLDDYYYEVPLSEFQKILID